ncbi:MAG: response regulator transcription factor [Alphaproteobacteria bacterium]|nr:response regulator transcription factor [Alphaproteobacteria bacterium]
MYRLAMSSSNVRQRVLPPPVTPVVYILHNDETDCRGLADVVCEAGCRTEAVSSVGDIPFRSNDPTPSCLVVDGSLLGEHLRLEGGSMPLICLVAPGDIALTVRAMKAGAVDVLTKPVRSDALLEVIRHALDFSADSLLRSAEHQRLQECYASLSHRERQVMELVVSGLLNKQVGEQLNISEITVKAHRGRVMKKMEARSLAHLIRMAMRIQV